MPSSIGEAYSRTGATWELGPGRIYNRLAEIVVAASPVSLAGRVVLDHGAGTGAASRAIAAVDGVPVAADAAFGMLAAGATERAPATVADAGALPFPDGAFGAVISAFCLNHLPDPVPGLRELIRVIEPGGAAVVATYAEDDTHPVKGAVEAALREAGWEADPWYHMVKCEAQPQLATAERAIQVAETAGLRNAAVEPLAVRFPDLDVADLVSWRFGMAQHAWFLGKLGDRERSSIAARAIELLGDDSPPLVRSILILTALVNA